MAWRNWSDTRHHRMGAFIWTRRIRRLARRATTLASVVVFVYGALAFGVPAFIGAVQPTGIGARTELPMGWVENAFVDRDGTIYCASTPWSRVQVYNRDKRFLRGWFVDASGALMIRLDADGHVRVLAARNPGREFVFDTQGQRLWTESYAVRKLHDCEIAEDFVTIPTSWYLLPFAHPELGWLVCFLGMAMIIVTSKRRVRHRQQRAVQCSSAFAQ